MLLRFLSRETTIAAALAGLMFWAPLPAGSVTPAAELLYRLAAFGLLGMTLATASRRWRRAALVPVAALGAVAVLGVVQSLPWPASAAAIASPEHVRLYRQATELVDAGAERALVPLSLDAAVSRSSAVSWFAAAALLAVILTVGRRSRQRRWLASALVAAALVQVGVGLLRLERDSAEGLGEVLLRPWGRLQGAYPNPNSLAFLFEMSLVVAAAWCWWALAREGKRRPLRALLPLSLWLVLLAAVVATGSRAGLVAALFATSVQAVVLPLIDGGRRRAVAVALVVLVGLGALIVAGSRLEIRRYETVSLFEDNLRSRLLLVGPALELWQRFPATGTGLGTFQDAFPLVAPAELSPTLWNRAHNDPLELLVTGGVAGLGMGLVVVLALLPPIWRAARRGRKREEQAAGLAALGALAAAALHELMDFGLVIPANSLALLAILGSAAAVGLSRTPAQPRERPPREPATVRSAE